ncbi:MAG: lysophospholipid acyltransferase family protein [Myxococcota bacterium]
MGPIVRGLVLVTSTIFFSFVSFLALPFGGRRLSQVASLWGRVTLYLCGVRVDVEGSEHLKGHRSFVVMSNHSSHFDVLALFGNLDLDMCPVAKRELGFIPVFGWVLVAGAAVMVDRRDRIRAVESLKRAGEIVRGGRSVLLFPEGTRTPDGMLGPLKKGPFHLALEAQVPVLPVGVRGSAAVLPPRGWKVRPGRITLHIGQPIPTAHLSNRKAEDRVWLTEKVAGALAELSASSSGEPEEAAAARLRSVP